MLKYVLKQRCAFGWNVEEVLEGARVKKSPRRAEASGALLLFTVPLFQVLRNLQQQQ